MTEKRDVSKPTQISICIPGEYILIKDLNGTPYIFPQSDSKGIGEKIVELAKNQDLPFADVGRITVTDSETVINAGQEGFDIGNLNIDDLSPDKLKTELVKGIFGMFKGATNYPRSAPPPKAKAKK